MSVPSDLDASLMNDISKEDIHSDAQSIYPVSTQGDGTEEMEELHTGNGKLTQQKTLKEENVNINL